MQLPVFANQYHTENHCIVQGGNASVLYKGCCGAKPTSCSASQLAQHFYRTSGKPHKRLRFLWSVARSLRASSFTARSREGS